MELSELQGAELVTAHVSWATRRCTLTMRRVGGEVVECIVHDVDRALMGPAGPPQASDRVARAEFLTHGPETYLEVCLTSGELWVIHGARWSLV